MATRNQFVLITGGAGFLGSHLADRLLEAGARVRVLDVLDPQVHSEQDRERGPRYLSPELELQVGNVLDRAAVDRALEGVEAVVHFAAVVGVGQSLYQIARYTETNVQGTSVLLEAMLARQRRLGSGLARLLVAGSMSLYGEGRYWCNGCAQPRETPGRSLQQLQRKQWEMVCAECGTELTPQPTDEAKPPRCASVYALSKSMQEEMCLMFGQAYGVPTVSLRFFNAYGPRQALSNPYTGVATVFANELLAGRRPQVFEDGRQLRDLVSVHDIARACQLALGSERAAGGQYNIASGKPISIAELARTLARALNSHLEPLVTGRYRQGDARHCFADTRAARERLGFEAQVDIDTGMGELAEWLHGQSRGGRRPPRRLRTAGDEVGAQDRAMAELQAFGLTG